MTHKLHYRVVWLPLFAILLLANSCEKEPEEVYLEIDEELSSMIEYDVGSYWVLQNQETMEIDTLSVSFYSSEPLVNEKLRSRRIYVNSYLDTFYLRSGLSLSGFIGQDRIYDGGFGVCEQQSLRFSVREAWLNTTSNELNENSKLILNSNGILGDDTLNLINADNTCQCTLVSGQGYVFLRRDETDYLVIDRSLTVAD